MDLFDDPSTGEMAASPRGRRTRDRAQEVGAAVQPAEVSALAASLPAEVHLGTSSWNFPGWKGLVWDGDYPDSQLSKKGIGAYALHPLLRTVSLDRSFYRPLSAIQYAAYAAAVPELFRFVVKAPSLVTDSVLRGPDGQSLQANPAFLNADLAINEFVRPALEGLGTRIGALVFQLGPLPARWLASTPELLSRIATLLTALPRIQDVAPHAVVAIEVRNPQLLTPEFVSVLRAAGATYCLGLHAKMPPIEAQLPVLRALWPAALVCRWNLHRKHGGYGYQQAKNLYEPFDRLQDPDPETRDVLARVIAATASAGFHSFVTINNKAEGCAPLSVLELTKAVLSKLKNGTGENVTNQSPHIG
jgi:uncharacterized protein YecE (DUF72 family)